MIHSGASKPTTLMFTSVHWPDPQVPIEETACPHLVSFTSRARSAPSASATIPPTR